MTELEREKVKYAHDLIERFCKTKKICWTCPLSDYSIGDCPGAVLEEALSLDDSEESQIEMRIYPDK